MGGTLQAIETGFIQREIQNSAFEFQKKVEDGSRIVVGVNRFRMPGENMSAVFRVDPENERSQIERLREIRASRSIADWRTSLDQLEASARSTDNLMPRIIAAACCYATVGEISDTLRRVFGEYREQV
jgi:methylmalonyl-CoA mutase N-terminal domain/subunit